MRTGRWVAGAAVAAVVLVISGCGGSAPAITDEQVATWEKLAAATIPAATDVSIRADRGTTMVGSVNLVVIDVHFANFADLKVSEQAVLDLQDAVETDAPGANLDVSAINAGAAVHEEALGAQLVADVPGVVKATVIEGDYYLEKPPALTMWVNLHVYVDDPSVVTPTWLDQVAGDLQAGVDNVGGTISGISILPASAADLKFSDPDFFENLIYVKELKTFKDFGVHHDCVRTDSWAYDVSKHSIDVYPADQPGGSCG